MSKPDMLYIQSQLYGKPWLLEPGTLGTIHEMVKARVSGQSASRYEDDGCGDAVEVDGMEITDDGVAQIPIAGVIVGGRRLPIRGTVHSGQVISEILEAEENPAVRRIEFLIDSPGGMVTGTPELADAIFNASKPTAAIVQGQASSAGYWIASAADTIIATRSASVGSIGVFMAIADVTKLYENLGVKMEIIKSGDLKAAGIPGTSLSDDQRENLRKSVEKTHAEFISHVRTMRGQDVPDEAFRGQSFHADEALKLGLIDFIV